MKRPFAVIGFSMLGTLFVFSKLNSIRATGIALAATLVALLFFIVIKSLRKHDTVVFAFAAISVSLCLMLISSDRYSKATERYENVTAQISGTLSQLPYSDYGKYYYIIRTDEIDGKNEKLTVRLVSSKEIALEATDRITVNAKLFRLGKSGESYVDYYKSRKMFLGATVFNTVEIEKHSVISVSTLLLSLKSKIAGCITDCLGDDRGAVICALLIGEKRALSDKAELAFRNCGISHLFAVSGLHLSVWAFLIFGIMKRLRCSEKASCAVSICFCFFFMLLTGFNPPVVRAGFMLILLFAAKLFNDEADNVNSIGLALTVLLVINTFNAVSVSLWLSLLATLSLISVSSLIITKIDEKFEASDGSLIKRLLFRTVGIAVATASVMAFTMPVYVFAFGNLSAMTLPSNLIMVFIGSVCMQFSGVAVLLILSGLSFAGIPLLKLCGALAQFLIAVAQRFSDFRFALIDVSSLASKAIIIITIIIFTVLFITHVRNKKIIVTAATVCALAFIIANGYYFAKDYNNLSVCICNTQKGIGAVVKYKGRSAIICNRLNSYDSGTLKNAANKRCVTKTDIAVVSPEKLSEKQYVLTLLDCLNVTDTVFPNKTESIHSLYGNGLTVTVKDEYAKFDFYQTNIVFLFSDDIILDSNYADIIIGSDFAASLEEPTIIYISRDGRTNYGGTD